LAKANISLMRNKTYSLGGIAIIDRVEKEFGFFSKIFKGVEGNTKNFIPLVKVHLNNRLTYSVSTHQILETYPIEVMRKLGVKGKVSERTLYRVLERIGRLFPVLLERYQEFIEEHGLADNRQIIDFTSTYFEGEKADFASYGYSRDKRPDKMQINLGISTGINGIPTALTIQRGNVQDKKHMREMLKVISSVLPENSLLIFDSGANTKTNKGRIRELGYHYLTLKAKKIKTYKKYIGYFKKNFKVDSLLEINGRHYYYVKEKEGDEFLYIFLLPGVI